MVACGWASTNGVIIGINRIDITIPKIINDFMFIFYCKTISAFLNQIIIFELKKNNLISSITNLIQFYNSLIVVKRFINKFFVNFHRFQKIIKVD